MDRKTLIRIAEYLTLAIMMACAVVYLYGGNEGVVIVFAFAAWIHGICWGYLFALRGRLTWF